MAQPVCTCFDRIISADYQRERAITHTTLLAAYRAAIDERAKTISKSLSKNSRFNEHVALIGDLGHLSVEDPVHVLRMAVINQKKWQNAYTLRCRFLDGNDSQRSRVQDKATIWHQYANINIVFVDDVDAEIRISFQADSGSWSAIGNDCLVSSYFPPYQPTMNFGWLRDDTPDQEYERVVVHEFGHALGCIHEHQSPTENLNWNREAVYQTFSGPPNFWTKDEIDQNILKKYSPEGISATQFDPKSIMLYQFDGTLFTDGKGTPLNTHLSDLDSKMIAEMYPAAPRDNVAT